jgi:ElaA protein
MPAFKPGISFDNASIGRVVVDANYRTKKWGHDLMRRQLLELQVSIMKQQSLLVHNCI